MGRDRLNAAGVEWLIGHVESRWDADEPVERERRQLVLDSLTLTAKIHRAAERKIPPGEEQGSPRTGMQGEP